jgi:hypothetical protein
MASPKKRDTPQKSSSPPQYWCHPQQDGHPTLYFHGHALISRADYVSAVGPDDCDPHIATGQGAKRKRGPKTVREQMKRM